MCQLMSNMYFLVFRLTTLLDPPRTLEYLAYLGYHYHHDTSLTAIQGKLICSICMEDYCLEFKLFHGVLVHS